MKKALAYDKAAKQFRTDIGGKRWYLGGEAKAAQDRKLQLLAAFKIAGQNWTPEASEAAEAIRRGIGIDLRRRHGEGDEAYLAREHRTVKVGRKIKIRAALIETDVADAEIEILKNEIAGLKEFVAIHVGQSVLSGLAITVWAAMDAWVAYRSSVAIDINTGEAPERIRTELNNIKLLKRLIEPQARLTALNWTAIHQWASEVAKRPMSKKTGRQIKHRTALNLLKTMRQFIKWAGHQYNWKKPDDWHEATSVRVPISVAEKKERIDNLNSYYTPEEIGVLWHHAIGSERLLLLLSLNFGFTQAPILALRPKDMGGTHLQDIRSKVDTYAKWPIWAETNDLYAKYWETIPKRRQHISTKWKQLIERVQKSHPNFKVKSFKWFRKCGSSMIVKIADEETASRYLSHGETVGTDDQLRVYAAKDWSKLEAALIKMREILLPHLSDSILDRTVIPVSTIDRIKSGWIAGEKVEAIMAATSASRATCYRHRPAKILALEGA